MIQSNGKLWEQLYPRECPLACINQIKYNLTIHMKGHSIHVIPPSSSGKLQEMSRKIGKNSSKMYHIFNENSKSP